MELETTLKEPPVNTETKEKEDIRFFLKGRPINPHGTPSYNYPQRAYLETGLSAKRIGGSKSGYGEWQALEEGSISSQRGAIWKVDEKFKFGAWRNNSIPLKVAEKQKLFTPKFEVVNNEVKQTKVVQPKETIRQISLDSALIE